MIQLDSLEAVAQTSTADLQTQPQHQQQEEEDKDEKIINCAAKLIEQFRYTDNCSKDDKLERPLTFQYVIPVKGQIAHVNQVTAQMNQVAQLVQISQLSHSNQTTQLHQQQSVVDATNSYTTETYYQNFG